MAFVPVAASTFLGTKALGHTVKPLTTTRPRHTRALNTPTMSEPSANWKKFAGSMLAKNAPTYTYYLLPKPATGQPERTVYISYEDMMVDMRRRGVVFRRGNMQPRTSTADKYMAACVTNQYKATSCSNGIYGVTCTEGTTRGAAEETRVMALAADFRSGTRDLLSMYNDVYENRKMAITSCHGCTYEEKLVMKFSNVATAMVTGQSEADGVCARYAAPTGAVEKYMTECVDKQNKFRAVANGVYGVMCQEGSVKGMAEYKRTVSLGAKFRAAQLPDYVSEQIKFNARKYGRERYAGFCNYEEGLFNDYPSTAMTMRPVSVRH